MLTSNANAAATFTTATPPPIPIMLAGTDTGDIVSPPTFESASKITPKQQGGILSRLNGNDLELGDYNKLGAGTLFLTELCAHLASFH